jgi:peptide/nickel transport system ATP-binding protein
MPLREPVLSVRDLRVAFASRRGTVHAVNGVSFDLAPGDRLGIVGESGCGKSVTSLALLGVLPPAGRVVAGTARFEGRDLLALPPDQLCAVRGRGIAMVFQDPMTSLNPVITVGRQIRESLETHFGMDRKPAERRAAELLDRVGIPRARARLRDYPHELSGGMRQRAMIAVALACEPRILIADEPTTALDVTVQAQILALLRELVDEHDAALMLITHDLGVVAGTCERTSVMYGGMFVETGSTRRVLKHPRHPYTVGLLQGVPRLDSPRDQPLRPIPGAPPEILVPPRACPFEPRCPFAVEESARALPALEEVEPGHRVACFNPRHADEWRQLHTAER